MRIAYICADLGVPVFGRKGCSIHVQEVLRALMLRGADVDLFAMRFDGAPSEELASVLVHALPSPPKGDPAARERAALAANALLYAKLNHAGPFDLVYERYSLWSYCAMQYAHERGLPALLEVNAPLIEEQAAHRSLVGRRTAERVALRVFGAASALLAVSAQVAAYLERFPVARGRVHVVPNGVDPQRFPAAPRQPGSDSFTIGFVGSLKPWHGLDILVEAFATLHRRDPSMRLLIVGDGPQRASLAANLAERELADAAQLVGAVDPAEVPAWLATMDVAVAPYPQLESFYFSPLKVYEYMAAGLPVVASRIGQLADLIEDGVTGMLCPPGDVAALVTALARLRAEAALRRRLGSAARAAIIRDHTWEAVAGRIIGLAGLDAGLAPAREKTV